MDGDELNWKKVFKKILLKDDVGVIAVEQMTAISEEVKPDRGVEANKATTVETVPLSYITKSEIFDNEETSGEDEDPVDTTMQEINTAGSKFLEFDKPVPEWNKVFKQILGKNDSVKPKAGPDYDAATETRGTSFSMRGPHHQGYPRKEFVNSQKTRLTHNYIKRGPHHQGYPRTEYDSFQKTSQTCDSIKRGPHHQGYRRKEYDSSQKTSQTRDSIKRGPHHDHPHHQGYPRTEYGSSQKTSQACNSVKKEVLDLKRIKELLAASRTFVEPERSYNLNDFDGAGVNVFKYTDGRNKNSSTKGQSSCHVVLDFPVEGIIAVKPYTSEDRAASQTIKDEFWDDDFLF